MASRAKKGRQSRMHAAIDAMRPYGFSPKTVQAKVRALLKEYGGDDNWPFIESDAYSLLISSILEEQEEENAKEKSYVGENLLEATGKGLNTSIRTNERGGSDVGSSELALCPVGSEIMDTASHTIRTVGNGKKESSQTRMLETTPIASQPLNIPPLQLVRTLQPKSQNLNGWLIEDDDDYDSELLKLNQGIKPSSLKRKHSNT